MIYNKHLNKVLSKIKKNLCTVNFNYYVTLIRLQSTPYYLSPIKWESTMLT